MHRKRRSFSIIKKTNHKSFFKKGYNNHFIVSVSQHKIGLTYSLLKKNKKKTKQTKKAVSEITPNAHLFHMVKTQTYTGSASLSHLSVLFLLFYASDVQNIIAPVEVKHKVKHKAFFHH